MILLLLSVSRAVWLDGADVIFHGGIHHGSDAPVLHTAVVRGARRPQKTPNISLVLVAHHSDQSQQVPRPY